MSRNPALRIGLTGGLGSGKSTVAAMFAKLGAYTLSADEIARDLMEPGTSVFTEIITNFGPAVLKAGRLDRPELARLAFTEGRVEELNAIIHPATIALQAQLMAQIFTNHPDAIVVVESALIFETLHGENWRQRFDHMVLVTAPDDLKIQRFISRSKTSDPAAAEAEAKRRLARIMPDDLKAPYCDFVIQNNGSLEALRNSVAALWHQLLPIIPTPC